MSTSKAHLITLKSGLTVPVDAVDVLIRLEQRGLHVQRDGDGLSVGPAAALTDEDRAAIRELKPYLLALVDHCTREARQ
jgi:hypothetical protein